LSALTERLKAKVSQTTASLDEKKTRLGKMGEICVGNWASTQGKVVIHAIDPYDSQKDLVIDGVSVEVKTQTPYINEMAFSIRPNQIRKCRAVDELYFVALPSPQARFFYEGQCWVYKVDPKAFIHREIVTRGGKTMILVDIKQPAVVPVVEISPEDVDLMMRYSTA
jgi:hypothetical protein